MHLIEKKHTDAAMIVEMNSSLSIWSVGGILKDAGWDCLGEGSFKSAFLSPDKSFVLKIHGRDQHGCRELRNYETAPAHIKPMLLPLIMSGDRWQIQPFAAYMSCDDAGCNGYIDGMDDSDSRNHTHHTLTNEPIIFDYGQENQWYETAVERESAA